MVSTLSENETYAHRMVSDHSIFQLADMSWWHLQWSA